MAKKPETRFREGTYRDLNSLPNTSWESIQQVCIKGTPDILMCINGYFVALEYKKDIKTEPEPIQVYKHKKITEAHGKTFIVHPRNWQEVFKELQNMANRNFFTLD